MSYFKHIKQDVTIDINNSSTTNLAAGNSYTFTGTSTSTLGVGAIQVSLKTDKNCTIYIDQSPDGTNWDLISTFNYYASINNFGTTVKAINSYVRVRVISASLTTTYFRLQTALLPIGEPLPTSLDENGHLTTAIHVIEDGYGFEVENTPMGEMRVVEPVRLVGTQFDGTTIDPNFWTATTANSATITQANSEITLTSGTNSAGSAQLNTLRRGRYIPANAMRFRGVIQLGDTGTTNNTRRWGIAWGATMPTITDGAYFQLSGTTFSVVTLKGSSATTVNTGSFNGVLGDTYSPTTNVATYEIYWTNSKVYFVIGGLILHTVSADSTTWSNTMHQHIYLSNINSGNTTSVTLKVRTASISRLGKLQSSPTYYHTTGAGTYVLKYGPGLLHSINVNGSGPAGASLTIYDNTAGSGTVVAIYDVAKISGPTSLNFNSGVNFNNGLTLVQVGTWDSTIVYE